MNLYCGTIYIIKNNVNQKYYIGQTTQDIEKRFDQHVRCSREVNYKKSSMIIHRAIHKYGVESFSFDVLETIYDESFVNLRKRLDILEEEYVSRFNSLKPNGYNMTLGGDSAAISNMKPVDAYDYNGNLLGSFDSIMDGAKFLANGDSENISLCCDGKRKYIKCIIWRWKGEPFDKYDLPLKSIINIRLKLGEIAINQYDYDGNLVGRYTKYAEISKKLNINHPISAEIYQCCTGKLYNLYGYIWRYSCDSFDKYNTDMRRTFKYPINVYDINDVYIGTYKYSDDIINYFLSKNIYVNTSGIRRCCVYERKTYKKHKFYYANDVNQPDVSKIINITKKFDKSFTTTKEAS